MRPAPDTSRTAAVPDYESHLVAAIVLDELSLMDEQAGSRRLSVLAHYQQRIRESMWELARIAPDHPLLPAIPPDLRAEPAEPLDLADRIRNEMRRWFSLHDSPDTREHVRALCVLRVAELENRLAQLEGRVPEIDLAAAQDHYADVTSPARRARAVPPHGAHGQRCGQFYPARPVP